MARPPLERGNNFKRDRYHQFLELGFSQEWIDALTLHHPALYDNPKAKIDGLRERGFDNPVKLITSMPPILGLAFENIDAKLEGLKQRGFDNPTKLITTSPPKGLDTDQIIEELINDKRIDPRLIRALSRI
jgi:hypothetical protein